MAERKKTKRSNNDLQNITQKLKIVQHQSNKYPGENSGTPEEQAFPAQLVAPVALQTRWKGLILISISISFSNNCLEWKKLVLLSFKANVRKCTNSYLSNTIMHVCAKNRISSLISFRHWINVYRCSPFSCV